MQASEPKTVSILTDYEVVVPEQIIAEDRGAHSIVIDYKGKGYQAYTFTFG